MDLSNLKAKKRQLFNELKRVLHEDEIRKKNMNKERCVPATGFKTFKKNQILVKTKKIHN